MQNVKTVNITRDNMQVYSQINASTYSGSVIGFDESARVALSRLQLLLCDDSLTLDAMPEPLAPVIYALIAYMVKETPIDDAIQSEQVENYSYTRNTSRAASSIDRIRAAYGDILAAFSKCEGVGGEIQSAEHIPLYTPDYYRDTFGGLD